MAKFFQILLITSLLSVFGNNAWAEVVKEIKVEGTRRVGDAAVLREIFSQKNKDLDETIIRADIERIYKLGFFDNIDVLFDDATGRLTYSVKEKPTVVEVVFRGNKEKKDSDLKNEITTKEFTFFDPKLLKDDLKALESFYDARGYFLAEPSFEIEQVREGEVRVVFNIKEGREVRVRRINILGNKVFTEEELKGVMRTKEGNWLSFLTDAGTYQDGIFEQDRIILTQYYGKSGYIKVKVSDPNLTLSADRKELFLTFRVEEGEQYNVGDIEVSGDILTTKQDLLDVLEIEKGEIADSIKIRQDVEKLAEQFSDVGYFYVNVIPQTRDYPDKKIVDINFVIQKGDLVYVEKIDINGNTSTRDKVIRREMRINEGELYSSSKIRTSRFNLQRTAYFEEANVTTVRGSADDKIVVKVDVIEKSTGSFSLGAGFNSIESFQFIGQLQKRNLFGLGYDVALQARLGGRTQTFSIRFVDPYFLDTRMGFNFSAFNTERQFVNFQQASIGGTVGLSFLLYEKEKERINFGVNYSLIDESIQEIRQSIENLFSDGITSSMTFSLTRDTRNRVFQPSEGTFTSGSAEFADGEVSGDNTFGKFLFEYNYFYPIIPETAKVLPGSVLQFRFKLDYVTGFGQDIPLFERFFPGGITSIRGFELRSLGPQIQIASANSPSSFITDDFPIGGNKQVIFNAEYLFPLIPIAGIRGVVFFDLGNAYSEGELINFANLRRSTGFGIRWFSPIGPLRFEWGFPLDRREDESPVVFDFTIGALF